MFKHEGRVQLSNVGFRINLSEWIYHKIFGKNAAVVRSQFHSIQNIMSAVFQRVQAIGQVMFFARYPVLKFICREPDTEVQAPWKRQRHQQQVQ